ncbi:dynein heavy chain 17, axonemal [Cricetulus griseus]|nr:dynein heavy chain 17, axonemal [Cricetulus griseus]
MPDARLDYLENVSFIVLKYKADKWGKLIGAEENMAMLTEFFDKADIPVLVLTLNPAGMIVPCLGFPETLKSKGLYFIKTKPENVTKDNYKTRLLFGDISPTPVEQLIAVVEEVLYSLLNQSENMNGWPRVVSEDIVKQVHRLKNEMFVMGGKVKGKTLLPIPEHLGSLDGTLESMERIPSTLDNSLLHSIETIIIDWSHQIRDVLSKDSAQALLDGLHPLPRVEFDFWDARLMNLRCIHEQLNRPKVNKIVEILEKAKSCYWPALQNVYMNVTQGLKEASDIVLYLKPLRILLDEMEQADFTVLPNFIVKVLSTICFIWATSEHYNTPSRVIVILREFSNQIIEMTRTYLSPEEVLKGLQGEIEEVLFGISLSVGVLKELFHAYDFCCANMKIFFKDKTPVPWEFPSSLAFSRMNSFFHRVQTIEDLYKTAIEFLKLEKIEVGGVRGNILGNLVTQIYDEVFDLVKVFAECKYDPLDPGDSVGANTRDGAGSSDSSNSTPPPMSLQLLYMCGGLLERPLILVEVVPRYSVLLEMFNNELDNAKLMYDAQMAASAQGQIPPIHKNMSSVAGQLKWSLELQERLEVSMRHLKHIEHPVMSSVEAKLVYEKYDEMMELLKGSREKIYQQWVAGVDQDCHFNLGQPLIQRDPYSNLIQVNFSKAVGPWQCASMEMFVGMWVNMRTTVMEVEFPLIKLELEEIDIKLLSAETTLFWNGENVFQYIQEMREVLYNLQNRIQKAKQNVEGITQAMQEWSANPLFERKDNKKEALLDLDGRVANLNKRYAAVKDAGVRIQAMVAENAELFRADTTSQPWKDYVNYIDSMVLDEFDHFIRKSLTYLMDNMTMDESIAPLFEIRMELDEEGLTYNPSLEMGEEGGFLMLIEGLINDLYNVARLIPRLAKGRINYKTDLEDITDLIEMREEVSNLVIGAMKVAEEYQDSFERYSYLWVDDLQESMKNFLIFGHTPTPEELDTRVDDTIPKTPPSLAQFQQQIDSYEKLYEEVSRCENTKVFHGWLQCDCRPFKQALLNTIKRWSFLFKRYLSNHVTNRTLSLQVNTSIDDWKTTKWKDINVEQMDIDCKKFAKDVRSLDKEMKTWDAFVGLDNTVKNMITSLRAVSELQNPAIRDRHWQQLMQATQILKALDSTWTTMEFEHEPHPRTGTMMLKSDEVLVETLEDNQVQLQNLMMSKYLSHFLKEVTSWQQKLSTADSVISIWFEVQRTWGHLESIFIGSEDIRAQLPEDSKRFDGIDQEFKALMADAVKTPNVVEATNKPGLYDKLEMLKKSLAVCEKALAEYLETKRLAFPRFYFVSSADLLDILSNGNDPVEVSRHLSKLFDSLCKLKFRLDASGQPVKIGLGMYSKEDEFVDFDRECDLSGQVEVWLNRVLDRMCATLRHEIPEAVVTYEEKPREQWIFDYPAQVESSQAFTWQSQLRHRWDEEKKHCFANICDAQIQYSYEYLGNTPRLVITPLTDSSEPRDLALSPGRGPALGQSPQSDTGCVLKGVNFSFLRSAKRGSEDSCSCGNIYKGLAQTGAWGCFDEFNRISVEVLSVIAVQVQTKSLKPLHPGLFSTIMRDLANITHDGPKWIVLDGDIDPMWIESLNTVMDDNKVLTLASNERIPLNRTMRLVFEISHLRTATPATVSRAGILYINPADLGWNPVVSSWIERRKVQSEKANLTILFDKYLPTCLDKLRVGFKRITPVPEITIIQTILYLLECLLTEKNAPPDSPKELYELYFVFACFWAFGGAMFQDQLIDYRVEFSRWWINEFKTIKLPSQGTIFDYYIDPETKKFMPWTDKVPAFELDPDVPLQASLVHTTETIRIRYFMDLLMAKAWPVMLVGNAGTGKSVLMGDKLESLGTDDYLVQAVPFNFYTTSAMLQGVLEKPLEKKSGRNYGPPGTKKLIYFIDDMNMPEVDKYGTVAPHTLIRQHMDHGHWYDRQKLTLKDVHNCQYVACMNPTSGSFTIDSRLQRHFCVFAVSFPGQEALITIYNTILAQHLSYRSTPLVIQRLSNQLVNAALALHQKIASTFLPTAIKFHYIFNLRDLSNIFQGILFSLAEILRTPLDLVRLWLHEAERVYGDKMVDDKDQETLRRVTMASTKKFFDDLGEEHIFARPNIFCHFAQGIGDPKYFPVTDVAHLNKLLVDVLDSYNEVNAVMNLVLFDDAVAHICKINRILESPRGNALLVGVGGSGKQSLSRLAAYISALDVFQITLKKGYSIPDLKIDLAAQYIKSAVKNVPSVFLMTDSQVAEEQFLVLINDLLASGEIPGLFGEDDLENIIFSMRPQVKSLGMNDTREACWKFFIEKVRKQLKPFHPVTVPREDRARMSGPAHLIHPGLQPEVKTSISLFMAYVHTTVNEMSKLYLAIERRYNYTTPKTFLEQIKLYQNLLAKKRMELVAKIERLENGLMKLQSTASQVDDLKAKLAIQEAELKQKNENADKLIQVVGVETEKVSKEKAIADEEEIKVEVINKNVTEKQKACETDLAKAEPALIAAQEALDTLNKNNLTELKSFGSPPDAVVNVTAAVMILTAPGGKIPKDKSWKAAKIMMGKVDTFLDALKKFDKEHIPEACLKAFRPYQGNPTFDPEFIRSKSTAAAGLCSWCINIVRFYEVYCDVAPKRQALEEANAELAEAQDKLSRIKNKIAELNANLSNLTSAFEKATAEKIKCQQEADATNRVISLANRLVGGLASENVRWAESVENFKNQGVTLCGDVLLISAFVSYVGYFTKKYRNELMEKFWIPYINKLKVPIPITEGLDPLTLLTDDADVASWNNQGLPSDRMSTENATILCNTERWPLIVDAQLQGIKWIKNKYGDELKAIRLGQKSYLDIIEHAISDGDILLIENIGETVDPVLDPLLGRNTIKKGNGCSYSCRAPRFTLATPQAFNVVFEKAIQNTMPAEEVKQRVMNLTDEITYSVFMYTARGLFERDKLIFLAQVTFQDTLEMCTKEIEFKCILFALCYFHAVVAERRKFGAQGWNRSYPFNNGDLTISINVLYNYLEANPKVPWDDLRYLFGEIMYGGHITDDWDRRLCRTYLMEFIRVEMLEGEVLLAPGFQIPPNLDYKVKAVLDEILEKIPETFNMAEIMAKAAEKTPYVVVAFQECERMNILTNEMRRSLKELNLGLKGELTITTDMEDLSTALFYDTVPDTWVARAYPSMMGLAAWYADLLQRIRELEAWTTDFALPTTVWLAGFFNPQSFLTAIMQSMARKNEWPLDKMCLSVEVTKKNREDMTAPPREGSYVYGLFMEGYMNTTGQDERRQQSGARWDTQTGVIAEARLKDLTPAMPVIFIKAIPVDRMETKNIYECPVYKTRIRGPTYVWTFNLKTKEKAAKWILAAVALLLQV